jgi:ArsR family transcriptional regulator
MNVTRREFSVAGAISIKKMEKSCEEVCLILKALSHPQRLMIMSHLVSGEKTVSELIELCEISQSQISQFLNRMKAEGLLTCRREGKFQFYSAADDRVLQLMQAIHGVYCKR